MSDTCSVCAAAVNVDGAVDSVKCDRCGDVFHAKCCGMTSVKKLSRRTSYRCGRCTGALSLNSDLEDSSGDNCVLRPINELRDNLKEKLETKLSVMDDRVNGTFNAIQKKISDLGQCFENSLAIIKAENVALREECEVLKNKVGTLSGELNCVKDQVLDMQQYSRLNNLEIVGVPPTDRENIYSVLNSLANAIDTPWRREDVSIAHRLPSNRKDRPPGIVIRLVSRSIRADWLAAASNKRNLSTVHLSSSFQPAPVFVNEHLTAHVKSLLSQAKKMVKEKQLAYAWVKEGRVLVKVTADGRTKRVNSPDDLVSFMHPK
ncbi:uncharacterized protein LOC124370240 [Homalodisca vitripennis]|uniref:uncharacterized protein LOC124370240 n=1 Tax=Homalodisca vitripennis TaxID=197043 RepID=UPI001EEAAB69|nr:uncharacterized protein LOC124370240 [Homalodisca vitripennis]